MFKEFIALDLSSSDLILAWARVKDNLIIECQSINKSSNLANRLSNDKKNTPLNNSKLIIQHDEFLISELEKLRIKIKGAYKNLSAIIINKGPGSFTGIRIALSFAKGLKIGLETSVRDFNKTKESSCQIIGLQSMYIWRNIFKHRDPICVVLDARSNKYYVSYFSNDIETEIKDLSLMDTVLWLKTLTNKKISIVGLGALDFYQKLLTTNIELSSFEIIKPGAEFDMAKHIMQLGIHCYNKKEFFMNDDSTPLYIRSHV